MNQTLLNNQERDEGNSRTKGADALIRKILLGVLILLAAVVLVRIGWLSKEVSHGIAKSGGNDPTIFYSRPLEIRKGDHPGNLHFIERLNKLSYKRMTGKPSGPGMYSANEKQIRIFPRGGEIAGRIYETGPVDIVLQEGRVMDLISSTGKKLEFVQLEPEEIGRMLHLKMKSRRPVTLAEVSPYLQKAVVAHQDKHFYYHPGIDLFASGRKDKEEEKGTITQQMIRIFFFSPQKTFVRKLHETELVLALELRYSKKRILEIYLNSVYFGQDGNRMIFGVEEAARFYFAKSAKNLSLPESAMLAGMINEPNAYNLLKNQQKAQARRDEVLTGMRKQTMITEDEYRRASKTPLKIKPVAAPVHISFFVDYIQRITQDELRTSRLYQNGYRYYTTLDTFQQSVAEEAVARGLEEIDYVALPADEPLQAALVAVDPRTGALTAMVGGRSYAQSWFNRAVDAKRQSGSAFKPFVLLAALSESRDMTLSTLISGEPISLPTPEGIWTPTNFENKQYGPITIRKLIEDSVNTATVRLAHEVGFDEVLKTARLAGIKSPLAAVPSLALGSFEVSPMEMAYAYATIASGGIHYERFPLFSVTTAGGEKILEKTVKSQKAFDPRIAYLAGYAMEGVLLRGTAAEAKALHINFPVSGKTGTTNGNRDSWFVCFTPDVVCAVWVGYDSGADTGLTGAQGALRISAQFLRGFYSQAGPTAKAVPQGIETALIDIKSGYLAKSSCPKTIREAYLKGTAPEKYCPDHH
ncbi:MAG: transglycosylase domain-containing protein [Smithella sp.]